LIDINGDGLKDILIAPPPTPNPFVIGDDISFELRINTGLGFVASTAVVQTGGQTEALAQRLGATHLLDHPQWMDALLKAIANPSTRITVNLSGFEGASVYAQVMGAVQRGMTPLAKATEWELAQIYQAGRLGTVNFVDSTVRRGTA
jgi:hypothetical protein